MQHLLRSSSLRLGMLEECQFRGCFSLFEYRKKFDDMLRGFIFKDILCGSSVLLDDNLILTLSLCCLFREMFIYMSGSFHLLVFRFGSTCTIWKTR